jgi:hypothetical protein
MDQRAGWLCVLLLLPLLPVAWGDQVPGETSAVGAGGSVEPPVSWVVIPVVRTFIERKQQEE